MFKPLLESRSVGTSLIALATTLALWTGCGGNSEISSANGGEGGKGQGGGGRGGSSSGGGGSSGGSGGSGFTFQPPDAGGVIVPGGGDDKKMCGFQKFVLERKPAELMLVLDRSGSMGDKPRGGVNTKWVDATAALDETIMKTAGSILWGLKMFPTTDVTCEIKDGVEVPSALDNYAPVTTAYKAAGPLGDGTPTAQALLKTVAYLQMTPSTNARYLVLATDGEPTCMDGINGDLRDDVAAVAAVDAAAKAGFHTFVLGIATGTGAATVLNNMAVAGLEPRPMDPKYYPVANRQDLINSLGLITGKISDCNFSLTTVPPSPNDVAVKVDGTRIERDTTMKNGWDYGPGMKSIQLFGAMCDQLKAGTAKNVDITYGCPGFVIN